MVVVIVVGTTPWLTWSHLIFSVSCEIRWTGVFIIFSPFISKEGGFQCICPGLRPLGGLCNLGLILPKFGAFSTTVGGIANIQLQNRILHQRNRKMCTIFLPLRWKMPVYPQGISYIRLCGLHFLWIAAYIYALDTNTNPPDHDNQKCHQTLLIVPQKKKNCPLLRSTGLTILFKQ